VTGGEALARWHGHGIGPAEFVPIAEEAGLVGAIGHAVLDHVAASVDTLLSGLGTGGRVWVNVSPRQLNDPRFTDDLISWCGQRGLTTRIGIEITESTLAQNSTSTVRALEALAEAGFELAIDDFGTGYSSLARLASYPVHMLKIDRSFILGLDRPKGRAVVAAVIDLAHAFGAAACAEGIETPAQLAVLRELGVDRVSGYLLAKPGPAEAFGPGAEHGRRLLVPALASR
jgi:EAL domain-containing protein (putative c-di-GMP-specific phosphodiesterase class I)